jgi:hypothetical protein
LLPARNRSQFSARRIVPEKTRPHTRHFLAFFVRAGTGRSDTSVCYRRTSLQDKMRTRVDVSPQRHSGEISMTLTVAHISPIMSVIAGLLILIMPRLLNFVVAIFLILNGLIGLGLLKWLHM